MTRHTILVLFVLTMCMLLSITTACGDTSPRPSAWDDATPDVFEDVASDVNDNTSELPTFKPPTLCLENAHIVSGFCMACPAGTTNRAGDRTGGSDTFCDPIYCDENEHVRAHECVQCGANTVQVRGDDASGEDTTCENACEVAFGISCDVFEQAYVKASNTGRDDLFGSRVVLSGDTMVVAAHLEDSDAVGVNGNQDNDSVTKSGSVYVFVRQEGVWTQQAYLKPSNNLTLNYFGSSLALDGDTLVIGASGDRNSSGGPRPYPLTQSAAQSGAVYVFTRRGTTWVQEAYLKASTPEEEDFFGSAVALHNNTLVVGAPGEGSDAVGVTTDPENSLRPNSGAVYVFRRGNGQWSQDAYIKASNPDEDDSFGTAVSLDNNILVIGSPGEASSRLGINPENSNNTQPDSGAVYVFAYDEVWTQQAYIKSSNPDAGDLFGLALDVHHDTMVIGAPGESSSSSGVNPNRINNNAPYSGAVYVFVKRGDTWLQQAFIKSSYSLIDSSFGYQVSLSDDTLAVSAVGDASDARGVNGDQQNQYALAAGAVYTFTRQADQWTQQAYIKSSNTELADFFGWSIDLDGETLAIGASQEDSGATGIGGDQSSNTERDSGAVYVRQLGPTPSCDASVQGTCAPSLCGLDHYVSNGVCTVCPVGHVNHTQSSPDGPDTSCQARLCYEDEYVSSGSCVQCPVQRYNTPGDDATGPDTSCIDVCQQVFGLTCSEFEQAYIKSSYPETGDNFGVVALSGDTLVVGMPNEDSSTAGINGMEQNNSLSNSGAVYVFVREQGVWTKQAYIKASNPSDYDFFGSAVAIEADTLVVGAPFEDGRNTADSGAAYVFSRQGSTWTQTGYLKATYPERSDAFGSSVAISGGTIGVGAPDEQSAETGTSAPEVSVLPLMYQSGAVYIFVRSGPSWAQQAYIKASNTDSSDRFGSALALSANTLVVGAPWEASDATGIDGDQTSNLRSRGAVYIFVRQNTQWTQQAYVKASVPSEEFGSAIDIQGDLCVVGAPAESINRSPQGSIYDGGAVHVFIRQGQTWSHHARLLPFMQRSGTSFGMSVALEGDRVAIGAPFDHAATTGLNTTPSQFRTFASGAAYTFTRQGAAWTQEAYIKASNTHTRDEFGAFVDLSLNTLVVGAPNENGRGNGVNGDQRNIGSEAGAVYVRLLAP